MPNFSCVSRMVPEPRKKLRVLGLVHVNVHAMSARLPVVAIDVLDHAQPGMEAARASLGVPVLQQITLGDSQAQQLAL